jgi:hypothetical protein
MPVRGHNGTMSARPGVRTPPDIEIRTALGGRLAQSATLAIGGFVAVLVTIALAGRGTLWAILAAVALGIWVTYFCRLLNMSVVVRGDVLKARNLFSTHQIARSAVGQVTLGESSVARSPNQTVVLALADGQHLSLDACARTSQSRRKRRRVEDFHRRLTQWSDEPTVSDGAIISAQSSYADESSVSDESSLPEPEQGAA